MFAVTPKIYAPFTIPAGSEALVPFFSELCCLCNEFRRLFAQCIDYSAVDKLESIDSFIFATRPIRSKFAFGKRKVKKKYLLLQLISIQ